MAAADPSTSEIPDDHELDELLNGTLNGEDIFDTSNIRAQVQPPQNQKPRAKDAELGIDEEIKIVKKRQPIPKLDEKLLLSDPGVPKLRRISKERLKFKGKGHEYGDIARMLNMYQLWLDDLYPRAKFGDGLAIIEKLGHSKSLQMHRKGWIDEGKPRYTREQDEEDVEAVVPDQTTQPDTEHMEGIVSSNTVHDKESGLEKSTEPPIEQQEALGPVGDDDPDEDELDMLLAESAMPTIAHTSADSAQKTSTVEVEDPFADDMAAMAEMEDMW